MRYVSFSFAIVFFLLGSCTRKVSSPPPFDPDAVSVAVLGASESLGGGAHPDFQFDSDFIWDVIKGERQLKIEGSKDLKAYIGEELDAPQLLWQGKRDYRGGLDWVVSNLIHVFAQIFFDTEEYSFGYILAKKLKVKGENIFLAGELGAKVSALRSQSERLLDRFGGKLPEKIFIFFTGNDLCAQSLERITSGEDFGGHLRRGLEFMLRNGKAHPRGTSVYVVSYLGATQLLLEPSIQEKKVWAFGQEVTCKKLREQSYLPANPLMSHKHSESVYFSNYLPPNPAQLCPTIFSLEQMARNEIGFFSPLDEKERKKVVAVKVAEMISTLSNRVRIYRNQAQKAVSAVSRLKKSVFADKNIEFQLLTATESLDLVGEDLACNCFDLSLAGQLKIAKALYAEMESLAAKASTR